MRWNVRQTAKTKESRKSVVSFRKQRLILAASSCDSGGERRVFEKPDARTTPGRKKIAEALEQHGWSVWWDRMLLAGDRFDKAIQKALHAAKCVIVLWSKTSVSSDWVREEAFEGAKLGILVPVLIDDVEIPFGFRQIHAARLTSWLQNFARY